MRRYVRSFRSMSTTASWSRRIAGEADASAVKPSSAGRGGTGMCGLACDLVEESAVPASRPVRRHATAVAVARLLPLDRGERRLPGAEEVLHERELRSRARGLQTVEDVLVDE